jgi:peroxiredoxin
VALNDFCGCPLILVFYPADWEPVSREQLTHYQALLVQFRQFGAALVGISMDSIWSHLAFAHVLQLDYPLLADVTPRGAMTQAYGVYSTASDTPMRALFVIDGTGVIRWTYRAPLAINPGADGILNALEALR